MATEPTETRDASMWHLWMNARKIPRNGFNCAVVSLAIVGFGCFAGLSDLSPRTFAEMAVTWSSVGLDFSGTILGFLIAGFTVFATLGKPEMFKVLKATKSRRGDFNYLQITVYAFFETFLWYLGFAGFCAAVFVIATPSGPGSTAMQLVPVEYRHHFASLIARVTVWALCVGYAVLMVELKSFVYNLYSVSMLSLDPPAKLTALIKASEKSAQSQTPTQI